MQPSRRTPSPVSPVAGLLLILAVLTVVAACGAVGAAAPSPSAPASPAPTAPASPAPSDDPAAEPTSAPSEAPSGAIDLDTADDHDVSVVIEDEGGLLAGSGSGRSGDGMSVRWGDVEVVNVDEDTLRVTWVGLPVDTEIRLVVSGADEGVALAFTQPAPPANSDAIGFDRVLVLDFAAPVRAADVDVTFATAS
jgi:hypothetical protein